MTWFRGGCGSIGLVVGVDLESLFQPKWFYNLGAEVSGSAVGAVKETTSGFRMPWAAGVLTKCEHCCCPSGGDLRNQVYKQNIVAVRLFFRSFVGVILVWDSS